VRAGLVLAVLQVGGIAGRLGFGVLSDRLGSRGVVMSMSAGLAVVACLAMATLGHGAASALALVLLAFLLGLSCMGWNALYITLSAEVVPVQHAATAVGAGTTVTFIGMFAVPPVFGLIADHTGSYAWSWAALGGWALLGLLVSLAIRDRARRTAAG
jgi:MFS family permease